MKNVILVAAFVMSSFAFAEGETPQPVDPNAPVKVEKTENTVVKDAHGNVKKMKKKTSKATKTEAEKEKSGDSL